MPTPVRGFADLHSHPTAHLGFGGKVLAGAPWHAGGATKALARCDAAGGAHAPFNNLLAVLVRYASEPHGPCGFDTFAHWPTHRTVYHQQMYVDWVKRAWVHGLRVLCALVVNNELLAERCGAVRYSDFNMLDSQLRGLREFVAYVHQVCDDAGVPRWLDVATSPQHARQLIANGQLAIVVGVELDTLESLVRHTPNDEPAHPDNVPSLPTQSLNAQPLQPGEVDGLLDLLVSLGVSMVTPMHLADNSFGGAAIYESKFDVLNRWLRGHWYQVAQDPAVGFQLQDDAVLLALRSIAGIFESPQYGRHGWHAGHVNARGLTPVGRQFLVGAMRRGLLVDVDHMSSRMTDEVLGLMDTHRYPALSSHSSFRALAYGRDEIDDRLAWCHEANKTPAQVDLILKHGGLVAPITNQHHVKPHGPVSNHQHGTSRTWAQSFLYAVDQVRRVGRGGVALGTDFNGLACQPGPRYQKHGPLDGEAVRYEDLASPTFFVGQPLSRLRLPLRAEPFDVNTDGLANYGLVPDFVEDLRRIGTPAAAIDTLFDSAEAFLQCWETCRSRAAAIP